MVMAEESCLNLIILQEQEVVQAHEGLTFEPQVEVEFFEILWFILFLQEEEVVELVSQLVGQQLFLQLALLELEEVPFLLMLLCLSLQLALGGRHQIRDYP